MELSAKMDDAELSETIGRIEARISNMRQLTTKIGASYERSVLENFRDETSPDGTPWQPLSNVTMHLGLAKNKGWQPVKRGLSARGKRYLTSKMILRESGDLMSGVHFQADESSVMIGVGGHIPYGAIHQLGGMAGRGRKVEIPARPYLAVNRGDELGLAEEDRSMIMDLIREEMAGWN